MTRDLAAFALANLLLLGAGHGVLRLIGIRPAAKDLPWSAVAYLAGASAVGVIGSAALVAGLSLAWWQIALGCLVLAAAGAVRGRGVPPPGGEPVRGLSRLLTAAALLVLAVLAADLIVQPIWTDDAWAIWGAKANSIVLFDGLDPEFLGSASVFNAGYPLVVPVLEVVALRFCGLPNELVVLQLGALFLAFPWALAALVRDQVRGAVLGLLVLAIAIAPSLQIQTASAVADVPLAVFFALAGVAGWRAVELGEPRMLLLAGVFAAAAAGTKVEGLVFVALLFAGLALLGRQEGLLLRVVATGLAAAATTLPWEVWSRVHSIPNAYSEAGGIGSVDPLAELGRIPRAGAEMLLELGDPTSWLALVGLAAAAAALAWRQPSGRATARFTVGVALSSLLAMLAVYWTTPLDFDYHLATSVRRVITAPVLFAAAMTPLLLSRAQPR